MCGGEEDVDVWWEGRSGCVMGRSRCEMGRKVFVWDGKSLGVW